MAAPVSERLAFDDPIVREEVAGVFRRALARRAQRLEREAEEAKAS